MPLIEIDNSFFENNKLIDLLTDKCTELNALIAANPQNLTALKTKIRDNRLEFKEAVQKGGAKIIQKMIEMNIIDIPSLRVDQKNYRGTLGNGRYESIGSILEWLQEMDSSIQEQEQLAHFLLHQQSSSVENLNLAPFLHSKNQFQGILLKEVFSLIKECFQSDTPLEDKVAFIEHIMQSIPTQTIKDFGCLQIINLYQDAAENVLFVKVGLKLINDPNSSKETRDEVCCLLANAIIGKTINLRVSSINTKFLVDDDRTADAKSSDLINTIVCYQFLLGNQSDWAVHMMKLFELTLAEISPFKDMKSPAIWSIRNSALLEQFYDNPKNIFVPKQTFRSLLTESFRSQNELFMSLERQKFLTQQKEIPVQNMHSFMPAPSTNSQDRDGTMRATSSQALR